MARLVRMVGLDAGTSYTRLWAQGRGVVLRCPTAAAIDSRTHEVMALGDDARRMLGKTPEDILAYTPIRDGAIAEFEVTARMFTRFFAVTKVCSVFRRPNVLFAAPISINEMERIAFENAVLEAGARSVAHVPGIYAAAVGSGLRVNSPRGSMIVSVGGGVSEAAVISTGCVIKGRTMKVAGDRMDQAIVNALKRRYGMLIGEATAEMLKLRLGTADPSIDRGVMEIPGRNLRTGLAMTRRLGSADIYDAIMPAVDAIARMILSVLSDNVPPEIAADVHGLGFVLCGGSALMPGLAKALSDRTRLKVTVARDPLDVVTLGLGKLAEQPALYGEPLTFRYR